MRIESLESNNDEEIFENEYCKVPNSENASRSSDNTIVNPEKIRAFYGTDDYEWNDCKLAMGNVYNFPNEKAFLKRFLDSLGMATKDKEAVNPFLPVSKNYVDIMDKNALNFPFPDDPLADLDDDDSEKNEQSKDRLFLNL